MTSIHPAVSPRDIAAARVLFQSYAASLDIDLDFQDFQAELDSLPGAYVPPRGILLLAWDEGSDPAVAVGCVAVRPFQWPGVAELKRLYVDPGQRGGRLGVRLTKAALEFAGDAGYVAVRLDTLPTMDAALGLYRGLGFREIGPYRYNPVEGTKYLELDLSSWAPEGSREVD